MHEYLQRYQWKRGPLNMRREAKYEGWLQRNLAKKQSKISKALLCVGGESDMPLCEYLSIIKEIQEYWN